MKKTVNAGSEFCLAMAHYLESLMAKRDLTGAVRYYESNRSIIDSADDLSAGSILRSAAEAYASLSDHKTALRLVRVAQSRLAEAGDTTILADTFITLGNILRNMGELKEAEKAFRDAESIYRRNDGIEGQSRALNLLAGLFFRQNDFKNALSVLMDAIEIARKLNDNKKLAFMLGNIGRIYTFTGNFAEAKKRLRLNIDLSTGLDDVLEVSRACLSLGYVHIQEGDYSQAEIILNQAHRHITETGDDRDEVIYFTYMGELNYRQRRYQQSQTNLEQALRLAKKVAPGTTLVATAQRHLAELFVRTGNLRLARRQVNLAMPVLKDADSVVEVGALWKINGILADANSRHSEAEIAFCKALDILDGSGVRFETADALLAAGCSKSFDSRKRLTYLFRAEEFYVSNGMDLKLEEISKLINSAEVSLGSPADRHTERQPETSEKTDYLTLCPEILRYKKQIPLIGGSDIPVLLTGETGVGKDHLARYFHTMVRPEGPFQAINCASLPDTLLESELFGFNKGAFTGATDDKPGLFVAANNGVLFLDEIGDLPLLLQSKLLRVLDNRKVMPLGTTKEVDLDVKLLAATNRRLEEMVESGTFRRDLYFRLGGITFHLPPLRERKEDIPLLLRHFMLNHKMLAKGEEIPPELVHQFVQYDWPGNIRELANKVKRLYIMAQLVADGDLVELSRTIFIQEAPPIKNSLFGRVEEFERKLLMEALLATHGNKSEAAKILGIHESTIRTKMKRLAINIDAYH